MTQEEKRELLQGLFSGATLNGGQNFVIGDNNTVNISNGKGNEEADNMPTAEQMTRAVEATLKAGLWWGNTAWSVVFRVMQMMGYKGSITQFIGIAENLALGKDFPYKCNMDAISKPLRNGKISRDLERWQEDGAPKKYIILASSLKEELEKD
jgi:hypothetical protein